MSDRRRICVVTGSRAEYGMLAPLMGEIAASRDLELEVAVTGAHLAKGFGETWRQIEADGFYIDARIDMQIDGDSGTAIARATGAGVAGFAEALPRLGADLVVVLGDRYEILAVAAAALMLRIPLLHLHGGEVTEGAIDDSIRHAVTKLAHIHCVATEEFAVRVRQLGEAPEHIHVVGTLALDAIAATALIGREALAAELGADLAAPLLAVTFHPPTAEALGGAGHINELLAALDRHHGARVIITMPNADPGNAAIRRALRDWTAANAARARAFENLGSRRYWSLLAVADAVVGNSSSGLIEAPHFGVPVVNIGDRQRGRPRAPAVLQCEPQANAIAATIEQALAPQHRVLAARRQTPYGGAGAARRIVEVIRSTPLEGLLTKHFRDVCIHA